jgi:hypothetical protein
MRRRAAHRRAAVVVAWVALSLGSVPPARAVAPADRCDWPMYGHDIGHSFAAGPGCSTLTPRTALTLSPDWVFLTPDSVTASPTVAGGTAYVGDWGGTFYALPLQGRHGSVVPRWKPSMSATPMEWRSAGSCPPRR